MLARYKSRQVARYVQRRYPGVCVLVELMAMGTGGSILQNREVMYQYSPDVVIILNGDHLVHLPLRPLLRIYKDEWPAVLMLGVHSDEPYHDYINPDSSSGQLFSEFGGRKSDIAYTGISAFRFSALRECIGQLPLGCSDITKDIVEWIYKKRGGDYYILQNEWDDLGTWRRYCGFLYRRYRGEE